MMDPYISNISNTLSILKSLIPDFDMSYLPVIHIAGTKGKGSTCLLIASLLEKGFEELNFKIGLFTSPHLRCVTERIQINRKPINKELFASLLLPVLQTNENNIFLFQLLTIIGIYYLYKSNVDISVIETGLGGTFDTTNIFSSPLATVITSIGWDHTEILGNSISSIASNKAGIIKKGVPVFIPSDLPSDAFAIIKETAQRHAAPLIICEALSPSDLVPLQGLHQLMNASLAVNTVNHILKLYRFQTMPAYSQFKNFDFRWPGRCEVLTSKKLPNIRLFVDGAHTPESIKFAIDWWNGSLKKYKTTSAFLLFSCSSNRNAQFQLLEMVVAYSQVPFNKIFLIDNNKLIALQFDKSFLLDDDDSEISISNEPIHYINKPSQILQTLQKISFIESNLLIVGSLYLVGSIFEILDIPVYV